jgi:hypothetical protein
MAHLVIAKPDLKPDMDLHVYVPPMEEAAAAAAAAAGGGDEDALALIQVDHGAVAPVRARFGGAEVVQEWHVLCEATGRGLHS